MSTSRDIAPLLKGEKKITRLRAEFSARPLRLAFVIRDDLAIDHLATLLEYNSFIWGGYYNALIPTDGEKIGEDWWAHLMHHQPDKVVFCGDTGQPVVSPALMKEVEDRVQPFALHEWVSWQAEGIDERHGKEQRDSFGSMPMLYPLRHLVDSLHWSTDEASSNVRIPAIERAHRFYVCVVAQVGIATGIYEEGYRRALRAESIEFKTDDLAAYLDQLGKFEQRVYPLGLTHRALGITHLNPFATLAERPEGLNLVLLGNNWVHDVCVFWNLRLAPSLELFGKSHKELLLPIDILRSPKNLGLLISACRRDGPWHTYRITVLSKTVNRRRLRRLADRLRLASENKIRVEVLSTIPSIADSRMYSTRERDEIRLEGGILSFKRFLPEFGDIAKTGDWVVDVDVKDGSNRSYDFPIFSKLNHLLCGSPTDERLKWTRGYWIRYAHERLSWRVNRTTSFVEGVLVQAADAFQGVFEDKGFSSRLTDKCPYAQGFLRLLGPQKNVKLLEQAGVRNLLWGMRAGRSRTFDDMADLLKLGHETGPVIDSLVQRKILLRGMSFRCEACGLLRWYPINELDESMQCAGCLQFVRPPVKAPICFRLNELAARAVEHGSIPVLLTQRLFSINSLQHALALPGMEVHKEGLTDSPVDIDFMTTYHGHLVLAECKEFKKGASPEQLGETVDQLSALVRVAEEVGAPIVLLSTLLPHTSAELAKSVLRLNRGGQVAVHLVSLSEMKFVNLHDPTKTADFGKVNLFCPASC